jgi:hypothetical protein
MVSGSCLCGQLHYELDETRAGPAVHCHCRDCQRVTGSGKATVVLVPEEAIDLQGSYKLYDSRGTDGSHVHRGFCPECGGQMLTFVDEIPGAVFVKAGTLDESAWLTVDANCWTGSASPWAPVSDDLPGFHANPDLQGQPGT